MSTIFLGSLYGLVSFSSVMMAAAEGVVFPQALTVPLALFAFVVTERRQRLHLSTSVANGLGLLAFVASFYEFMSGDIEARLLSGAHLLVYLTWIVLFQKKQPRHFWWMCALALLQVAVASVLTNAGWYGAMLALYLLLAIWTLTTFSLYQAQLRFAEHRQAAATHDEGLSTRPPAHGAQGTVRRAMIAGNVRSDASAAAASMTRWSIQHDPGEHWINARLLGGVFATTLLAIFIGSFFFLVTPRVWIGRFALFSDEIEAGFRPLTGFSEEVQLGDIGEILESTKPVLDVRMFDDATGQELNVVDYARELGYDEPLFRGNVLSDYQDGRWRSVYHYNDETCPTLPPVIPDEFQLPGQIRQEIRLEPIGTKTLFGMHPVLGCELDHVDFAARFHPLTSVIFRPSGVSIGEPLAYTVHSAKPKLQMPMFPYETRRRQLREPDLGLSRSIRSGSLTRLTSLAHEVTGFSGQAANPDPVEMTQRLIRYLRDSGEFAYTLDASVMDPSIDPIEDFLFNRKQGHCEYFSSALALMLRAVDIPSRIVSGFKGGQVNQFTKRFVVEQRHAHAWVEAFVNGSWQVLDATPAARSVSVRSMASGLASWSDLIRMLSGLWSRYVVGLSFNHQQDGIYQPAKVKLGEWLQLGLTGVRDRGGLRGYLSSPRRWFSLQGFLATVTILLVLSFVDWSVRKMFALQSDFPNLFTWIGKLLRRLRETAERPSRPGVLFYERFQKILATRGLFRSSSQTQLEFAAAVQGRLRELLTTSELSGFPHDLVGLFYRVRFGSVPLSADESLRIDQHLTRLEQSLAASGGRS